MVVQLVTGGRLFAEEEFQGSERRADPRDPEDSGASSFTVYAHGVPLLGRTFLYFVDATYGSDSGEQTDVLYGYACRRIREVLRLGKRMDSDDPHTHFELAEEPGTETVSATGYEPARYRWDARACGFAPAD